MRGSLQIARLFGIPVFVHWSFSFLLLFIIYIGKSRNGGWEFIAFMALSVMALFACVVLHEFGHALSARYFGVRTQDITILPIGGVARLDRLPEKPFQPPHSNQSRQSLLRPNSPPNSCADLCRNRLRERFCPRKIQV